MSDDFRTIHSASRWSGELSYKQSITSYLFNIDTKAFIGRKKLYQLQQYVESIQKIDFDKYSSDNEELRNSDDNCSDCGLCVADICSKCKPKNLCHYCGGYDGNFLRSDRYPCVAWCTPSYRHIPSWNIRPLAYKHSVFNIRTVSLPNETN